MSEQRRTALAAHNFKSVDDLADNFLRLEGEAGKNRVVLPGEDATPDQLKAFNKAIGVPEDPAGYKLPQENVDPKFAGWVAQTAHKHGIPAKAMEAFAADWQGFVAEYQEAQANEAKEALKKDDGELRATWKGDYEKNVAVVNRLATYLEWPAETVGEVARSVGYVKGMQGLLKLAGMLAEDGQHPTGGSTFSVSTPQEAEAELDRMLKDPNIRAALRDPNHAENKTLSEKFDRLQQIKTGIRMPATMRGGR